MRTNCQNYALSQHITEEDGFINITNLLKLQVIFLTSIASRAEFFHWFLHKDSA